MKTRGNRLYKYSYEVIKGILYRVYEHTVREIEKGIKQIVVPTPFREYVIRTAHGSLVGGHLATKKTMDRITSHSIGLELVEMCQDFVDHVIYAK